MTTAIVVDIQRFSLHDGPGIRTTVFLKGCPLSCTWCHNPESIEHRPQLSFNQEKCKNCFRCVAACTSGAHFIFENTHHVDFSKCILSGDCVAACPNEALKIIGRTWNVEEVMSVIRQDLDFYKNSGGGVTVSGGEPMTQFGFTKELLVACKELGIHTTLDTCGHIPPERYREILPYVDLFLYDYKETDVTKHREYTGASNKLILENLGLLYRSGAAIVLRCPIVPGFNDTEEHFKGIRDITRRYPNLQAVEIMPYHNMGVEKARRIGRGDRIVDLRTTERKVGEQWVEKLTDLGCSSVALG